MLADAAYCVSQYQLVLATPARMGWQIDWIGNHCCELSWDEQST